MSVLGFVDNFQTLIWTKLSISDAIWKSNTAAIRPTFKMQYHIIYIFCLAQLMDLGYK